MSGLIGIPTPKPAKVETPDGTPADAAAAQAATGAVIFDASEASFGPDVIEASMTHPIIVDFWAPWCGPCKTLAPALEAAVTAAGGAVRLAKVNIDENQQLAAQLRIQSIPTVYAFFQGQPVDGFQGALPASDIAAFVEKLSGLAGSDGQAEAVDAALAQAEALLEAGAVDDAQQLLAQVLDAIPDSDAAAALFARSYLIAGAAEQAEKFLDGLPPELGKSPAVSSVRASIALSKTADGLADVGMLRAAVEADRSTEHLFDLARKLVATGAREEGADLLLEAMSLDRDWNDGAARKKLLEMFDAYGNSDPFSVDYRRKLSAILFS